MFGAYTEQHEAHSIQQFSIKRMHSGSLSCLKTNIPPGDLVHQYPKMMSSNLQKHRERTLNFKSGTNKDSVKY